jgi:iron complex outermembrane receptor protein
LDDITFAQSTILGTGFVQTIGATRRQGTDAGLRFVNARWTTWIDCSFTDVTIQSSFIESGPSNPATDANGNVAVRWSIDCRGVRPSAQARRAV